jgi:tetratricopeptide (TPR) repeat protein
MRHHRSGELDAAEIAYRRILRREPLHADARHLLGLTASEKGAHQMAGELISSAIAISPETALYHANLGLVLARAGEWGRSILALCRAVELEPGNTNFLLRLGQGLEKGERWSEAQAAYQEAARVNPNLVEAKLMLGHLAQRRGDSRGAEVQYRAVLRQDPRQGEAHRALAAVLAHQGRLSEALVHFSDALRLAPEDAGLAHEYGLVLAATGDWPAAAVRQRQALAAREDFAEAWFALGNALHIGGQVEEAGVAYERAAALRPQHAETRYNLAVNLMRQERGAEAAAAFRATLELDPMHPGAHHNLATLAHAGGHVAAAMDGYAKALELKPGMVQARCNLAHALQDQDRPEEAEPHYRQALETAPENVTAHINLGNTLLALGRYAESQAYFEKARDIMRGRGETGAEEYREACWNLGVVQLLQGDWERGWAGYEMRLAEPESAARRFSEPLWNGESYEGETLLVHAEQGLGDTVQFSRYLRMAKHHGGELVLECQPELEELMNSANGPDRVVPRGAALPHFDRHTPLMSLARIFGTTPDTVPVTGGAYLKPPRERTEAWRKRIGRGKGLNVGVAWAGNPKHKNDRNRSLPCAALEGLAGIEGVRLYSLQKGAAAAELSRAGWASEGEVEDLNPELRTVGDTAAAASELDLVISADSMVAHLAGALARPVWTLITFSPDWRWMASGERTPWYPTMRLFRQDHAGDWNGVVGRVREELAELAAGAARQGRP